MVRLEDALSMILDYRDTEKTPPRSWLLETAKLGALMTRLMYDLEYRQVVPLIVALGHSQKIVGSPWLALEARIDRRPLLKLTKPPRDEMAHLWRRAHIHKQRKPFNAA